MRDGWHFIFVLALLIVMLLVMQQEAQAPYYAAALLIVINQVRAHDRWDLERCKQFLIGIAKLFTELAGILAGGRPHHRRAHADREGRQPVAGTRYPSPAIRSSCCW